MRQHLLERNETVALADREKTREPLRDLDAGEAFLSAQGDTETLTFTGEFLPPILRRAREIFSVWCLP